MIDLHLLGLCLFALFFSLFLYFTIGVNCVSNRLDAFFFYIMFFSPFILPVYEAFFKPKNIEGDKVG